MRKLLFAVVVTLGFVATLEVQAQKATKGSDPITLSGSSCKDDALHPIAGKTYSYTAQFNPGGGIVKWWATKNANFISSGTDNSNTALTTPDITAPNGNYNTQQNLAPTVSDSQLDLIWSTATLANTSTATPTFVVVKYDAPTGSCADNLKVYKVEPINAFTVDIKNMTDASTPVNNYGVTHSVCVSDIQGATYSATANKVVYDYGKNELYFEVVAANFTGSYTPTFQIGGLETGQTADLDWGYVKGGAFNQNLASGTGNGTVTSTSVVTNETDTSKGVSIYVKLTVNNNNYETLTNNNITLSVTGVNAANQSDVKNDDCNTVAVFTDNLATQTIKARPEVTNNTSGGDFIEKQ